MVDFSCNIILEHYQEVGLFMHETGYVLDAMLAYYAGDVRRINHFLKVYTFAKTIGESEQLFANAQFILEVAAATHDIGIKNSEIKYKSAAGPYQETEGPPEAKIMLEKLGLNTTVIERVCWLIAHHHTTNAIDGLDHQILIEADFLVNADEDGLSPAAIRSVRDKIFRTQTGKKYLQLLYGV